MTYDETVELEKNVAIKNKADQLCSDFKMHVKLSPNGYGKAKDRFHYWSDSHDDIYIGISESGDFIYQARFLHENYNVTITPQAIFQYIYEGYRGVEHFEALVNKAKQK